MTRAIGSVVALGVALGLIWTSVGSKAEQSQSPAAGSATTAAPATSAPAAAPERPPADVTSAQDRDQMMAQVGVRFPASLPPKATDPNRPPVPLRPRDPNNPEGALLDEAGNTIVRDAFGTWVQYEEARAGRYTPLQPLRLARGARVTSAKTWTEKRRPEILRDVQDTIWGRIPEVSTLPAVTWEVSAPTPGGEGDVAFVDRTLVGRIDTSRYPEVRQAPRIDVVLRLPAAAASTTPVPVIVVFGQPTEKSVEQHWGYVKGEGWGIAIFNPVTLQPDSGAGLTSYLIGLVNRGGWRKPHDWGTLVAYAWGVGRILDQFERMREIDARKVALMGHSRWGKATMVVMAYEPRVAIGFPAAGGTLGAKQFRRHWGQNLESISSASEYHWMAGEAFRYMGPLVEGQYLPRKVERLPVDGESLIALAAPRPVFLNGGTTDTWSDAPGTYLAGVAASPVYRLLGRKGLINPDGATPKPDVAYLDGDIGYRVHTGGHTPAPDWPAFVEFTRKYFR
jgi:hypothetical protein